MPPLLRKHSPDGTTRYNKLACVRVCVCLSVCLFVSIKTCFILCWFKTKPVTSGSPPTNAGNGDGGSIFDDDDYASPGNISEAGQKMLKPGAEADKSDQQAEPKPAANTLSAAKKGNSSSRARRAATPKPGRSTTILVWVSRFLVSLRYRVRLLYGFHMPLARLRFKPQLHWFTITPICQHGGLC